MAAVMDVEYLSAYLNVPQATLTTIVDAPTAELVRLVLEAVKSKAHEHNELAADKLRVDIELENAVRSSETRVEGLRSTIEKSQNTVEELRVKLKEHGNYLRKFGTVYLLTTISPRKWNVISRKRTPSFEILINNFHL
jgi:nucleoprotein TPR